MRRSRIFYRRSRPQVIDQFLRFGAVGATGMLVDWGSLEALRPYSGLVVATVAAYFAAASSNWLLNRLWTFRTSASSNHHLILQWLRFLAANAFGFLLNRGAVFALFATVSFTRVHPLAALVPGALCGMVANFNLSRRLVFQAPAPENPLELVQMAVEIPGTPTEMAAPEPDLHLFSRHEDKPFDPPP